MDNFFIAPAPPPQAGATLLKLLNKGLAKLGVAYCLRPQPNPLVDMTTVEQRINYFHLLEATLAHRVAGDVVELGCFTGQCALLFQQVIQQVDPNKELHLYDSFDVKFTIEGSVEEALLANFDQAGLPRPVLHKGYFEATLPQQLPERICFAHIDCGFGGDAQQHKAVVLTCLRALYPHLSPGAVCVLMDYHDQRSPDQGYDVNPGVKLACDEFLAGRPERVVRLYGNQYSHAFFRKC